MTAHVFGGALLAWPASVRGLADHLLVRLVEVNGLIFDARMLPIELQTEARGLGLIPNLALGQAAWARARHPSPAAPAVIGAGTPGLFERRDV